MSEWASVALNEVAEIERDIIEASAIKDGTPYIGLENIKAGGEIVGVRCVGGGELASSKFAFTEHHLLYGKLRPYLAKVARPRISGICSTDILPVLPGPSLDRSYLAHYLLTPVMVAFASSRATGVNLPRLNPRVLAEVRVPLPPLSEQRRIAELLDRVETMRSKRRAAISQVHSLEHAVFLEMFGDPLANPKGWRRAAMAEVVAGRYGVKAGPFGSSLRKADYTTGGYRVYGQEQVIAGRFGIGNYYVDERKYQQLKACAVNEDDILVSLVGSFGRVLVVPPGVEPGIINPRLLKITPNHELVTSSFLATFLTLPSTQVAFERMSHGGTMGILNAGIVKKLHVVVPPLARQHDFARRIAAIDQLAVIHRASLSEVDCLFASLQHRAFRGEL